MEIFTHSFPLTHFDPLALYQNFCPNGPGLLQSLNPQAKTGRFSIVPLRWQERYSFQDGHLSCHQNHQTTPLPGPPLDLLARILAERSVTASPETPFPGGFFGYFGYDLAQQIEDLPQKARRDLQIPELELYWVDVTAVYDHQQARMTLGTLDPEVNLALYAAAIKESRASLPPEKLRIVQQPMPFISPQEFTTMAQRGKDYIAAGDVYQVNLSCRFDGVLDGSSAELYRRLRE
ncbi:MAG: anthranilate synthase component I family protein, partial [Deltaproteobacteria bacterium]|nr:anthranilate synthase component I family protein [Deltaproteobacteria bacterium]